MLTFEGANNTFVNAMGDRGTLALNRCTKKLKTTTSEICNDKNMNVAEDVRTTLVWMEGPRKCRPIHTHGKQHDFY